MEKADIGLVGLAVMGANLCLNMESKGYSVAAYSHSPEEAKNFMQKYAGGKNIIGCMTPEQLADSLKSPRKIMMMIKAGDPVDDFIDKIIPFLDKGDILIDGGNSNFQDTIRRVKYLEDRGILFIGAGVSGGEEGALKGPSIMPGGSAAAWDSVKDILQSIAAKVDGLSCCDWVGKGGAGHYVKMVHNGIEYGDMQLICEAYHIMHGYLGMTHKEMHEAFAEWNNGVLESYLIEITRDILSYEDTDGKPILDKVLDAAGQKGTGKWTLISSLEEGVPLTLIGEACWARYLSAQKDERVRASIIIGDTPPVKDKKITVNDIGDALLASKIVSYAQGYALFKSASKTYDWDLNFGGIATMWRGGCIIRSKFLGDIKNAFDQDPNLENLLLAPFFNDTIKKCAPGWRKVCSEAMLAGIPIPALSSALAYFDGYRSERLPANLLQAQRDYFGAHTYERVDKPRGEFFHTNWTGKGGTTVSGTYNA